MLRDDDTSGCYYIPRTAAIAGPAYTYDNSVRRHKMWHFAGSRACSISCDSGLPRSRNSTLVTGGHVTLVMSFSRYYVRHFLM